MRINCVILDLDNTLYDWFHMWYLSFQPFLDEVANITEIDKAVLKSEFRKIHQQHRTSEYSFRLHESHLIQRFLNGRAVEEVFAAALKVERAGRVEGLKLYPTVLDSLLQLKSIGVKIIAYSDSMGFYISDRLIRLGLDGIIDAAYTSVDHEISKNADLGKLRSQPDHAYNLQATRLEHTPPGEVKPNPKVLLDIILRENADRRTCIYVGDSRERDIAMAQKAGVVDVFAAYGKNIDPLEYALLQEVSHWPRSAVALESNVDKNLSIVATHSVDELKQIFDLFEFEGWYGFTK